MNINEYIHCTDEMQRTEFEEHLSAYVMDSMLTALPDSPSDKYDLWADDTNIMCRTRELAKQITKMIELITGETRDVAYHYYDPEEDERNGDTDERTGWWYVEII